MFRFRQLFRRPRTSASDESRFRTDSINRTGLKFFEMLFLIISENIGWKLTILFFSLAAKTKKNQSNQPRWRKPSSFQFFSFNFFLVLRHFSLKQKITELIFVRLKILLRRRWWSASSFASAVGCGSTTTTTTMKTTTRSSGSAASAAGKACACPERWGEH